MLNVKLYHNFGGSQTDLNWLQEGKNFNIHVPSNHKTIFLNVHDTWDQVELSGRISILTEHDDKNPASSEEAAAAQTMLSEAEAGSTAKIYAVDHNQGSGGEETAMPARDDRLAEEVIDTHTELQPPAATLQPHPPLASESEPTATATAGKLNTPLQESDRGSLSKYRIQDLVLNAQSWLQNAADATSIIKSDEDACAAPPTVSMPAVMSSGQVPSASASGGTPPKPTATLKAASTPVVDTPSGGKSPRPEVS